MTIPSLSAWSPAQSPAPADMIARLPRRSAADLAPSMVGAPAGAPTYAGPFTNLPSLPGVADPAPPEEGVVGGRAAAPPLESPVVDGPAPLPGVSTTPGRDVVGLHPGEFAGTSLYTNLQPPLSALPLLPVPPSSGGAPDPSLAEEHVVGGRAKAPPLENAGADDPMIPPGVSTAPGSDVVSLRPGDSTAAGGGSLTGGPIYAGPYTNLPAPWPAAPPQVPPGAGIIGGPAPAQTAAGSASVTPPASALPLLPTPAVVPPLPDLTLPEEFVVGGRAKAPPLEGLAAIPPTLPPGVGRTTDGDVVWFQLSDPNAPGPFTNAPPRAASVNYTAAGTSSPTSPMPAGSLISVRS